MTVPSIVSGFSNDGRRTFNQDMTAPKRSVRGVVCASLAVVFCLSEALIERSAAQGTSSVVSGRVVDGRNGTPLAGATVLAVTPEVTLSQPTDLTGAFFFVFEKPVRIRLSVEKAGYLPGYVGQLSATDTTSQSLSVNLSPGAHIQGVIVRLWASAAIGGAIRNGTEPVVGATVRVLERDYRGDTFTWHPVPLKSARSDDRGQYRISGLAPGNYLVAVLDGIPESAGTVSLPIFAPGTHDAGEATELTLQPGTEATADIQTTTNQVLGSLAGRLLDGDRGSARVTVRIRRLSAGGKDTDFDEFSAVTDDSGAFRLAGLPIGAYKLRAVQFPTSEHPSLILGGNFHGYVFGGPGRDRAGVQLGATVPALPRAPTLYAEGDVFVEPSKSDAVLLRLQPAASISGRVVFQDGQPPASDQLPRVPVLIRPADGSDPGGIPQARIEADGTFRSVGLPPGAYVIAPLLSAPRFAETWTTVALTSGGIDVLGGTITLTRADVTDVLITVSTKVAELSGTVMRSRVSPIAASTRVIIFPRVERLRAYYAAPGTRRVKQVSVTLSGTFSTSLPPGEYLVAAVSDEIPALWMTGDYLARLAPWATPIRLAVGEKATVSLEARSVPLLR